MELRGFPHSHIFLPWYSALVSHLSTTPGPVIIISVILAPFIVSVPIVTKLNNLGLKISILEIFWKSPSLPIFFIQAWTNIAHHLLGDGDLYVYVPVWNILKAIFIQQYSMKVYRDTWVHTVYLKSLGRAFSLYWVSRSLNSSLCVNTRCLLDLLGCQVFLLANDSCVPNQWLLTQVLDPKGSLMWIKRGPKQFSKFWKAKLNILICLDTSLCTQMTC